MPITRIRRGRTAVLAAAVVAFAASTAGCGDAPDRGRPVNGSAPPVAPTPPSIFYVNPDSPAAEQIGQWTADGRTDDAGALRAIADRPTALWITDDPTEVTAYVGQADIMGQVPILVAYHIPRRDCGRFDTGSGAPSPDAYRGWIRDFAAGLSGRDAIVILEPNAIPDAVDGCVADAAQRYALLRDAIAVLKNSGAVRVYLDAGHPDWIKDVQKLASALNRAGIDRADGFALNVAGFVRTEDNIRYGLRISDALAGHPHFVIDTSRNGNGPYPGEAVNGGPSWCNPPGRALGEAPTDDTGQERLDALLWIKYPGESDGACRPGEPPSGEWWPEYALGLIKRTR